MNTPKELTLLDYFAISATEEDIKNYVMWSSPTGIQKTFTRPQARYAYARAMLKARKEKP